MSHSIRLVALVAISLSILLTSLSYKTQSSIKIIIEDYITLKYADLVVEGIIENVLQEYVSALDYDPRIPSDFRDSKMLVGKVRLEISQVLRGTYDDPRIEIVLPFNSSAYKTNYNPGDTVIVSVNYRPEVLAGSYVIWGDSGRFILRNNNWICQDDYQRHISLTKEEIRTIINETKIENIINEAEIIIVGRIVSIKKYEIVGKDRRTANVLESNMKIEEIQKGNYKDENIIVKIITDGSYKPAWRKRAPRPTKIGERWYAFLREGEIGYYPFAGSNGFLRIEDDKLIYDGRTAFQYTKKELDMIILKETNDDKYKND